MAEKKKKGPRDSFWFAITHAKSLTHQEYKQNINKVITFVAIVFVASLLVFIGVALFGGFSQVITVIEHANFGVYALAFVCVFFGYLISFGKWSFYLKTLKIKVPSLKNLMVYLSMYSMDLTPGRIGRVVTAYTLNRITKIRFIHIMPIVTMDIVTDFFGAAAVALAAAIYFNQFVLIVLVGVIISLIPSLFVLNDWFFKLLSGFLKKRKLLESATLYGEEYFAAQSELNKPSVYAVSMLFTIPSNILYSMSLYFSLRAIGAIPSLSGSVLIYYAAQIIGTMTSLPGNVGVTDASMVAMLNSIFSLPGAVSSAVTIMSRISSLWFGVILGGIILIYTFRYWKPKKEEFAKSKTKKKK